MKVYTYSQARQNLAAVLNESKGDQVLIRRRGGDAFAIVPQRTQGSPFDVPGIRTQTTTSDILSAIRDSRAKTSQHRGRS